jgi:FkbM family methyltransferase
VRTRIRHVALDLSRALGAEHRLRSAHAWLGPREERRNRLDDARLCRIIQRLPVDANIVDVGASHGTVLEWGVRYAPRGRHTAFEPLPDIAADLQHRFPSVRVVEAAVADKRGTASFWRARIDTRSSLRRIEDSIETTVQTVTLDDEIDVPPALVKIDVEGGEALVLAGALGTLRDSRPTIVFEHGQASRELFGIPSADVFDLLDALDMEIFNLSGAGPYSRQEFANANVWNFVARPTEIRVSRSVRHLYTPGWLGDGKWAPWAD